MLLDPRIGLDAIGKVLINAANHMERYGFCRGALKSGSKTCPQGAIEIFAQDRKQMLFALARVQRYLGVTDTAKWADEVCRDKTEAVAALRGAAFIQRRR